MDSNDPPPPYTESPDPRPQPPRKPSAQTPRPPATMAPPKQQASSAIPRQFPPTFSLYTVSTFGKSFSIGEHQNQPIYCVTLHSGWSSKPDIVLHCASSEDSPPLANLIIQSFSREFIVELPPPGPKEVSLLTPGWSSPGYQFEMPVPDGQGRMRLEMFQWRHSRGEAVAGLGQSNHGWKLVRLASQPGRSGLLVNPADVASDGCEVVAVYAQAAFSMTKQFTFSFRASGLSGELGEGWAIMAVMSALGLWEHQRRNRQRQGAFAGVGVGTAVVLS